MNSRDLISIIVPIYNAENTIEKCIKSICEQTYENIEIILVDDGSKDNSAKVCLKLAMSDQRIKLFTKKNGGVSSARNYGIDMSNGKYIGFVDADDWIKKNMYEKMYKNIEENNSQLVLCNYTQRCKNKKDINSRFVNISNKKCVAKDEILNEILVRNSDGIMGSCWRILINREFIMNNNLYFDIGVRMSEDMMFLIKCVDKADKISLVDESLYYYIINTNSVTSNHIKDMWKDMMVLIDWCNQNLIPKYKNNILNERINECLANAVIIEIGNICKCGTGLCFKERIKYIRNLCKSNKINKAIKLSWKKSNLFLKNTWIQLVLVRLNLIEIIVMYHTIKHKTFYKQYS